MNRNSLGVAALCLLIFASLVSSVGALWTLGEDPYVIWDDNGVNFWNSPWWTESNVQEGAISGVDCYELFIDANSQYESISVNLGYEIDFDAYGYDWLVFWWNATGSGEQIQIRFMNDGSNFFYYQIQDNYAGWNYYALSKGAFELYQLGSPDWATIDEVSIMMATDNAANLTYQFDYFTLQIGQPIAPYPPVEVTPSGFPLTLYVLVLVLLIAFPVLAVKFWNYLAIVGGLIGAIFTLYCFQSEALYVSSFYNEITGQIAYQTYPMGFFAFVPLVLTFLNLLMPFIKD